MTQKIFKSRSWYTKSNTKYGTDLTMKTTLFLFQCMERKGNVSFNDALNTFYLQLYDVGHMVKDHSDSERGNPLPPHGLLFLISSKGSFICIIPDRITHTTAFVTPGWNEK